MTNSPILTSHFLKRNFIFLACRSSVAIRLIGDTIRVKRIRVKDCSKDPKKLPVKSPGCICIPSFDKL